MRIDLSPNDPVQLHHETRAFRLVIEAFGYPARIFSFDCEAQEALLGCLCDVDTPVFYDGCSRVLDRSGKLVGERSEAEFIFASAQDFDWHGLSIGTSEAPETAATVVLELTALSQNTGNYQIQARGAGVKGEASFCLSGAAALAAKPRWAYPLGVDVILTCGPNFVALPRHLAWEMR